MRLPILLSALTIASVAVAEPTVTPLRIEDFDYAEWLADGSGFIAVGYESMQRFDAAGRARGGAVKLAGLPGDAVPAGVPMTHRGLSPDGNKLAVLIALDGGNTAPYVLDLARKSGRRIDVADGTVLAIEWLDGETLVGARAPQGRFAVDGAGTVTALCPKLPFYALHVDAGTLYIAAAEVFAVDAATCKLRDAWSPWPVGGRTWVRDFSFSPSGKRLAIVGGAATVGVKPRLYVLSLDRKENVDTGVAPELGPLLWLDEATLVYAVENGDTGTSQRRLERLDWRKKQRRPLVAGKTSCNDSEASAPPRGGRLVFRRLCDDPKDGFIALVR